MMKKLWIILMGVVMSVATGVCADPPAGWEQGYMMGGRFEYCFAELSSTEGSVQIDMSQSELTVTVTPKTDLKAPVSMTFGGAEYKGTASDYDNSWTFTLPAGKGLDSVLAQVAQGASKITVKSASGTLEIPFEDAAAKNIEKAYRWIMDNPAGLP